LHGKVPVDCSFICVNSSRDLRMGARGELVQGWCCCCTRCWAPVLQSGPANENGEPCGWCPGPSTCPLTPAHPGRLACRLQPAPRFHTERRGLVSAAAVGQGRLGGGRCCGGVTVIGAAVWRALRPAPAPTPPPEREALDGAGGEAVRGTARRRSGRRSGGGALPPPDHAMEEPAVPVGGSRFRIRP
jgi:hypothetical protein